jgi:hypothetical protein
LSGAVKTLSKLLTPLVSFAQTWFTILGFLVGGRCQLDIRNSTGNSLMHVSMHLLQLRSALVLGSALGTLGQWIETSTSLFPLQESAETPGLFPMLPCGQFTLEEATIDQMQQAMENGTLTSQQLVLCYMQRTYQTEEYIR